MTQTRRALEKLQEGLKDGPEPPPGCEGFGLHVWVLVWVDGRVRWGCPSCEDFAR